MSRVLLLSVLGCCLAVAQTTKIDLQNQSRGVDFSAAPYTKPVKTGTALPATCSTGEAYLLTTAVPGANFFVCTATNTWTLQGASGGVTDHSKLTHLDFASSGHTGFQPAIGYTPIDAATLAQPNGPAKLGSDGKILPSELPATTSGLAVAFSTEQATGNGSPAFNLTGTPLSGSLTITVNGQVQEAGALADYTLSGMQVTFTTSSTPKSGDRISFRYAVATGAGTLDVAFAIDSAAGTGAQAAFNLSSAPLAGSLMVSVNGQVQEPGAQADYTLSGSTVTFNSASIPPSGARISFHYGYSTSGGNTGGQISMSQLPAGIPNGLATLGGDGKVLAAQLPASQGGGSGGGGTQTFSTPGATTWTVPNGVSRVFVQVWAGGGGGAGSYWGSGTGGGGGGYAEAWCPVTAGATVNLTVGAGGIAGIGGTSPGIGGDSLFGACAHATGGGEGVAKDNAYFPGKDASMPNGYYLDANNGGAFRPLSFVLAGNGCFSCIPSRNDQGGAGAIYVGVDLPGSAGSMSIFGGGGGGSGANANTTTNQAGGAGGTSARGGNGGNGSAVSNGVATACTAGTAPGGGGGGGAWNGSVVGNGCAGARGQVTIWW